MSLDTLAALAASAIVGVFQWLMRETHNSIKDELKSAKDDIKTLQRESITKEDFKDFKVELFARLDKMEREMEKK
jgi:inorganic pyrophosphatase/exopolyphosphatase